MKKHLKDRGITLVALVVTIIILLILAGITINALSGENGLIPKVNQTKKAQIKAEMKETLILAISELQLEKEGKATLDNVKQEWANEALEGYDPKITSDASISGKKVTMTKDNVTGKYIIDEKLNITELENDSSIELTYEVKGRNGEKLDVLVTITDNENGLQQVEYINEVHTEQCYGKKTVSRDCQIQLDEEYKVKITSKSGEEKTETIFIQDYWHTITKNLEEGIEIDNPATKAAYNKQYQATITTGNEYILKTLTVTMDGQEVTTSGNNIIDVTTGEIKIEKVTGNIEIKATKKIKDSLLDENLLQGEVELKKLDKIVSNEIIKTPKTFTLSIEVKCLKRYYNDSFQGNVGPIVGTGAASAGWGGLCSGIFYNGNYIQFLSGRGDWDSVVVNAETLNLETWNKLTMTWDGTTVNCYVNDIIVGSLNGLSWKETKIFIGGWQNSPYYAAGVHWSNVNGFYRNLIFTGTTD